jgi:hypothetical protein
VEAARTSETLVNFYQTTQRYNPLIALMMEAARTSETLVNFYQTYTTTQKTAVNFPFFSVPVFMIF